MPRIIGTVTDDGTTKQTTYTGNVTNNNQNFYFDEKQDGMILTNNGTTTVNLTVNSRSYIITANNSIRIDEKLQSFNIMRNSPGSHTFTITAYLFHNGSGSIPDIPDPNWIVEDNLTSTNTHSALSANQGRVLNTQLADKATQITPTKFGAKGDGITDDTVALQSTVNYCITNNKILSSDTGKVYAISSPINITSPINIDFNMATVKAIATMESVIKYNVTAQHSRISNIVVDCNSKVTYGIYCVKGHTTFWNNIRVINVSNYGIYITGDYEYFFDKVYIQGNGQTSTTALRAYGDSHFSNFVILDCYVAINTANYSFYNNIHAWLSSTATIAGSKFMTGSGGGSFNQVYADTYQYAFVPTSNTNYLTLDNVYLFANPTIYTSSVVSEVPSLFNFSSSSLTTMITVGKINFWALNVSSGLTGGGKFSNLPLFQWLGNLSSNSIWNGIQAVPDNISTTLTLSSGWTPVYARAIKKNGRVKLEIDAQYTGNIPQNTNVNILAFGNGQFPDGFYPKNSKKIMCMIGGSFSSKEMCYGYLNASSDHSGLLIYYSGATTTLNYITIDIEYDV